MRGFVLFALVLFVAGCGNVEGGLRDFNKTLYRSMGGERQNLGRPGGGGPVIANCFSSESGMLYPSKTGRCATGYTVIPLTEAEQQILARREQEAAAARQPATRPAAAPQTATSAAPPSPPPVGSLRGDGQALCYDDRTQTIFGAEQCPPGSRWIDTPEAEALQRAALEQAQWCYFSSRKLLYRARACRPGDAVLDLASAERLWADLPAASKPRQRPSEPQRALAPVPKVDAAPRGRIDATPLPAPR